MASTGGSPYLVLTASVIWLDSFVIARSSVVISIPAARVVDAIGSPAAFRDFTLGDQVKVRTGQERAELGWGGRLWVGASGDASRICWR